jgi:glycosyltransferase involved in cell wall biosynthesis
VVDPEARRVLFVITSLGFGGAEVQLLRVAGTLVERGWQAEVVALRDGPGMHDAFAAVGVPVRTLLARGAQFGPGALTGLLGAVRAFRPDALVTFLFQANVLGRVVGAWCRVPVVSSIRNTRFGGGGRLGGLVADALERLTNPLAAAVVVNARLAGEALLARRVVRASTLRVIPNALARPVAGPPVDRPGEREALGLADRDFVWITIGRLERQKNHRGLLEAFAALHRERPHARLLVVGDGVLAEDLRSAAGEAGIADRVTFLGLRRDVDRLLALSDAFVLASDWEGLPNVVMEAQAAAVPALATPVGGVKELIEEGVTGWLTASSSPVDLHAAMRAVMDVDPDRRARIARAGHAHVLAHHGLDAAVDAWRAVILDATRPRGRA